jgi:predicted phosphodiesterase
MERFIMQRGKNLLWLAAFCLVGCAQAQRTVPGPYVNHVDASSARVLWVAEPGAPRATVRLTGDGTVRESTSAPAPIGGRPELLNSVAFKDLKAGTRYRYVISQGKEAMRGSFITAPAPGASPPIRFVVYGDTRTYPENHRRVAAAIAKERPEFVVCSGDLVRSGEVWETWQEEFFGPAASYLARACLWPVRGNHEDDAVFYRELFDLPGNELYYSFDWGNAHFVVLDCLSDRAEMLEWLERDLDANRAQWTFVFLHEPIFNVGGHASHWGREDFLPALERHGVDFVLAGHSHLYERFLPIGPPGGKPIIHIVSAGGGAPPYPSVPSPVLAGGVGQSVLHYCVFELHGNRCDMKAKLPDGRVIDSLSLVKRDDAYQDEVMDQAVDTKTAALLTPLFVDMEVAFSAPPRPGQTMGATLRSQALRLASRVEVAQAADSRGWRVVPAEGAPKNGGFTFEVTAPDNVALDLDGLRPGLRVALDVTVPTGTFHADNVRLAVGAATLALSIPAPEPVDVHAAPAGITVDGDLSEWAAVPSMPLPFEGADSSSVSLCWRPDGLYGAVRAQDETVQAQPEAPWRADCLELFIDKDFSRTSARNAHTAQYAFAPAPATGPGAGQALVAYGGLGEAQMGIRCAWAPTEGGYALEFFLPAEALAPAAMKAGTVMGLNFALSNDGAPVEQFYCDKNENRAWGAPIRWGAVRLAK